MGNTNNTSTSQSRQSINDIPSFKKPERSLDRLEAKERNFEKEFFFGPSFSFREEDGCAAVLHSEKTTNSVTRFDIYLSPSPVVEEYTSSSKRSAERALSLLFRQFWKIGSLQFNDNAPSIPLFLAVCKGDRIDYSDAKRILGEVLQETILKSLEFDPNSSLMRFFVNPPQPFPTGRVIPIAYPNEAKFFTKFISQREILSLVAYGFGDKHRMINMNSFPRVSEVLRLDRINLSAFDLTVNFKMQEMVLGLAELNLREGETSFYCGLSKFCRNYDLPKLNIKLSKTNKHVWILSGLTVYNGTKNTRRSQIPNIRYFREFRKGGYFSKDGKRRKFKGSVVTGATEIIFGGIMAVISGFFKDVVGSEPPRTKMKYKTLLQEWEDSIVFNKVNFKYTKEMEICRLEHHLTRMKMSSEELEGVRGVKELTGSNISINEEVKQNFDILLDYYENKAKFEAESMKERKERDFINQYFILSSLKKSCDDFCDLYRRRAPKLTLFDQLYDQFYWILISFLEFTGKTSSPGTDIRVMKYFVEKLRIVQLIERKGILGPSDLVKLGEKMRNSNSIKLRFLDTFFHLVGQWWNGSYSKLLKIQRVFNVVRKLETKRLNGSLFGRVDKHIKDFKLLRVFKNLCRVLNLRIDEVIQVLSSHFGQEFSIEKYVVLEWINLFHFLFLHRRMSLYCQKFGACFCKNEFLEVFFYTNLILNEYGCRLILSVERRRRVCEYLLKKIRAISLYKKMNKYQKNVESRNTTTFFSKVSILKFFKKKESRENPGKKEDYECFVENHEILELQENFSILLIRYKFHQTFPKEFSDLLRYMKPLQKSLRNKKFFSQNEETIEDLRFCDNVPVVIIDGEEAVNLLSQDQDIVGMDFSDEDDWNDDEEEEGEEDFKKQAEKYEDDDDYQLPLFSEEKRIHEDTVLHFDDISVPTNNDESSSLDSEIGGGGPLPPESPPTPNSPQEDLTNTSDPFFDQNTQNMLHQKLMNIEEKKFELEKKLSLSEQEIVELREIVESRNERIDLLMKRLNVKEKEVESEKSKVEKSKNEKSKMEYDKDLKIVGLKEMMKEKEGDIRDLKEEFEILHRQKNEKNENLSARISELEEELKKEGSKMKDHQDQVSKMKELKNFEIKELKNEYEKQIEEMKSEHESAESKLKKEREKEVDELKNDFVNQMKELTNKMEQKQEEKKKEEKKSLEDEIKLLESHKNQEIETLSTQLKHEKVQKDEFERLFKLLKKKVEKMGSEIVCLKENGKKKEIEEEKLKKLNSRLEEEKFLLLKKTDEERRNWRKKEEYYSQKHEEFEEFKDENDQLEHENEMLKGMLENMEKRLNSELVEMKKKVSRYRQELQKAFRISRELRNSIDELNEEKENMEKIHRKEVTILKEDHRRELVNKEMEHRREIRILKREHRKEEDNLVKESENVQMDLVASMQILLEESRKTQEKKTSEFISDMLFGKGKKK